MEFLKVTWKASNLPCSRRLKAMIPNWLPYYRTKEGEELSKEIQDLLLEISPSTIDRLFKPMRKSQEKFGFSTTRPGTMLRESIPVKTEQWEETKPGYLEADTVAHSGF